MSPDSKTKNRKRKEAASALPSQLRRSTRRSQTPQISAAGPSTIATPFQTPRRSTTHGPRREEEEEGEMTTGAEEKEENGSNSNNSIVWSIHHSQMKRSWKWKKKKKKKIGSLPPKSPTLARLGFAFFSGEKGNWVPQYLSSGTS